MAGLARYTTATAFLEHCSTLDLVSYPVPTAAPVDETAPPPALAQADHALYSSTWLPRAPHGAPQSAGFVLARIVEDAYALELRWVAFSRGSTTTTTTSSSNPFADLEAHPGTLPPVRFVFPSRLVPSPAFVVSSTSTSSSSILQLACVTEAGYLYTLSFPLATLFYDDKHFAGDDWCEEFKIASLEGRVPVLAHGVDEGRVIVGCEEGYAVSVEIAQGEDGALVETELRSLSSFSMRSLLPSFSNFGSPVKGGHAASHLVGTPTQLVSLASSSTDTRSTSIAFGVTRDRKLRIWNLESGACFRAIDLPKPASSAASSSSSSALALTHGAHPSHDSPHNGRSGASLLADAPTPLVKVVAGTQSTSHSSYLALFSPASSSSPGVFVVYGFASDPATGELSELTPVTERVCPPGASAGSLVDFDVQRMDLAGDAKWTLWTCWDEGGESEVRTVALGELEGQSSTAATTMDGVDGDGDEWVVVERGTTAKTAGWTAAHFDDLLRGSDVAVAETFLQHVARPGRYPPATLEYALEMYEDVVAAEAAAAGVAVPDVLSAEHSTPIERAAAVVGSTVALQQSPQTGAYLHDEYNKQLKLEWLRFGAFLNESRSAALFPTCLVVDEQRGIAAVVARDAIAVPVVREAVQALHSMTPEGLLAAAGADDGLFDLPVAVASDRTLRHDVLPLLAIIRDLERRLSTHELGVLERALREKLASTDLADLETTATALALFDNALEPVLSDAAVEHVATQLAGLESAERAVDTFLRLLTTEQLPPVADAGPDAHATTDLSNALLVDGLASGIEARYELVKGVVAVLLVAWGAEADSAGEDAEMGGAPERLFGRLDQTTAAAFAALHSLGALAWLAAEVSTPTVEALALVQKELQGRNIGSSSSSDDDPMFARFGELNVHEHERRSDSHADIMPVPTSGLLSALLRVPGYAPSILPASRSSLPVALAYAAAGTSTALGLLESAAAGRISASPAATVLGLRLQQLVLPVQAAQWVGMWPRTAGMSYVCGRAALDALAGEDAMAQLEAAASGLYGAELILSGGDDDGEAEDEDEALEALLLVLPAEVGTSLARYYIHVVGLFASTPFDAAVAGFAQLALDALELEGVKDEGAEMDLWTKLFRSHAALGQYDLAYQVVMSVPHHETQMTCLAHLISVVCENGAAALLTTYSFSGLEAELERNLSFRARNSDPLAPPNYYKVLYAYHVAKGDFRSAGTVMFQQGRRLGELGARQGSFHELAKLQCQSYLAATNALALVPKDHAWIAVMSSDDGERGNKRRKVAQLIPEDEFDPAVASRPLEVLELTDLRKEYCVALARLQLADEFPELERTSFHLEPESVVALFSQLASFDQAFQAGRILDVDLSSLFEAVTERCVTLALHGDSVEDAAWVVQSEEAATWEGTLSSKAWRLLERHLARHDDPVTFRYRLVALERTLATNRGAKPPSFLTDYLKDHDLPALLRVLIKYDRLDDAFSFSLQAVKTSSTTATQFSSSTPYSIYDQLLAIPAGDTASLSDDVLKQRQKELSEALDVRWAALEKANEVRLRKK
ncbi:hypothetical protein JCM9279_005711 [Rhodotorula babjevae]